jgi:hypothetical protein
MSKTDQEQVIADIVAYTLLKMADEVAAKYTVAHTISLDWCPCCGVNLRLNDGDGKMFAKYIADPATAEAIGRDLLRHARSFRKLHTAAKEELVKHLGSPASFN